MASIMFGRFRSSFGRVRRTVAHLSRALAPALPDAALWPPRVARAMRARVQRARDVLARDGSARVLFYQLSVTQCYTRSVVV